MYEKDEKNTIRNIIIIAIIIIILLLLHRCVLDKGNKEPGNRIDICDDGDENCTRPGNNGLYIDCLEFVDNPICIVPDFTGKTEKEIQEWLDKIANNIDISYQVYDSDLEDGIVINQSNEKNITVKDLLDNNIPLIISFANSRSKKIDCTVNTNSENCVVPNFIGKTKKDVYDWLDKISNSLNINFVETKSDEKNGTITKQSVKSGTNVKDLIDNNQTINITFSNNEKVDCLKDETNEVCVIPNFTGYTQKEIQEWLDSISNQIVLNYEDEVSDLKSDTIISQSVKPGSSIKNLIKNNIPLTITFAASNKDTRVDCLKDVNNPKCVLPDFSGMTKEDVEKWLESISNTIPVSYENVTSSAKEGNIVGQSINQGTTVKDILDNNKTLVISISKNKPKTIVDNIIPNNNSNDNQEPPVEPTPDEPTPDEPIEDDEQGIVIVKDSSVTWETNTEIDIFDSTLASEKIAPESSGTYRFSVNNNTEVNVKYNMIFTETNTANINMKFKLRKNNSYVVSEYSSISELNLSDQLLDSGKNDTFYLEWKWVSASNDTEIGANSPLSYSLKIEVEAEGTSE